MRFHSTPTGRAFIAALLLGLLLTATPFLGAGQSAQAAQTFVVTLASDQADLDLADAVCDVSGDPGNQCTLRAAIQEANATAGLDTIAFAIPGGGVKTIKPATALPDLMQRVTIDGYTQPGSRPNTLTAGAPATNAVLLIELDGSVAPNGFATAGLVVRGPNTVIRGLAIGRWRDGDGIRIHDTADGTRIFGCFVGTNAAGSQPRPNDSGIDVLGAEQVGIGNAVPAARNLISGNLNDAVYLNPNAARARVLNSAIGTTAAGTAPLPNGDDGIQSSADDAIIGGAGAADANVIRFNGGTGVVLSSSANRNRILRNAIAGNGSLGIDLGGDGVTANDAGDADTGANNRQNFPVITAAGKTRVQMTLNSTPNQDYVIRIFAGPGDGDEGLRFHGGPFKVTTDAAGNTGTVTLTPNPPLESGRSVTVTATNADGDTSEFSGPVAVSVG